MVAKERRIEICTAGREGAELNDCDPAQLAARGKRKKGKGLRGSNGRPCGRKKDVQP